MSVSANSTRRVVRIVLDIEVSPLSSCALLIHKPEAQAKDFPSLALQACVRPNLTRLWSAHGWHVTFVDRHRVARHALGVKTLVNYRAATAAQLGDAAEVHHQLVQ